MSHKKADYPSELAFQAAADALKCDINFIKAVAKVEAGPQGAFQDDGAPVILFERHKFRKHTGGKFDKSHPDLSNPKWGGYGRYSEQHAKLQRAAALDRDAALKSASWGLFQILGENYEQAGHATLQSFINAMYRSVDDHLAALVSFIQADARLVKAAREKDFTTFSRIYNGRDFEKTQHHTKMAAAFREFSANA